MGNQQTPCASCGVPTPAEKPPPIVLNVAGIEAQPIVMNPAPAAIDWARVVALPPFQQFVAEKAKADGADALAHAVAYARQHGGGQDLFDEYAAWHASKGLWPAETPLGELRNA